MRRLGRGSLAVLAAAVVVASPATAATRPTIDTFGFWSLSRLGVTSPIELNPARAAPAATLPLSFMPGASQGPAAWYLGHLVAAVQVAGGTIGSVYLDAAVGKWDWAQVRVTRVRRDGIVRTEWQSAGALQGGSSGSESGDTAHIAFTNFVPVAAVRAGPTVLSFRLERYGNLGVRRVTIGRASGLEYSRLGPARLVAAITGPHTTSQGSTVRLVVALNNIGDRPLSHVTVGWDKQSNAVAIAPRSRDLSLAPHRLAHVTFRLHALRRGRATLYLTALGSGAGTTRTYTVRVDG